MNSKICFILGAGFGTRMGKVGEKLPKILWPIFELSLLEIQVNKLISLGFEKIYLNIHYCHKEILNFIAEKNLPVECLYEEKLLDSGGAFHNLKKHIGDNAGNIFYINGDIVFDLEKSHLEAMLSILSRSKVVLLSKNVTEPNRYNRIDIEGENLVGITKVEQVNPPYLTYAGLGFINLDKLDYIEGESRFFDTVANFREEEVKIYNPGDYLYYDFGTKEEYFQHMFMSLGQNKKSKEIRDYLVSIGAFAIENYDIKLGSYNSNIGRHINLAKQKDYVGGEASIIMESTEQSFQGSGLYYKDCFEPLNFIPQDP